MRMLWGTPPRKENAETCPSQKASVVSAGYAFTNIASLWGQIQDEEVDLLLHTPYDGPRLTEVALGVARRMHQRHEHLACPAAVLSDVVLDYGVPTVEAVLFPQTLVYALGGVARASEEVQVIFKYAVDDPGVGSDLGSSGGLRLR